MAIRSTIFSLKLVKEKSSLYNISSREINSDKMAYQALKEIFDMESLTEEALVLLTVNTKNRLTGCFEVSRGSLNSSIVHPREVFKRALLNNAAGIFIAHNHPSGGPEPSQEDILLTKRLVEAGNIIGIELLDHIIVGDNSYISLKRKGII